MTENTNNNRGSNNFLSNTDKQKVTCPIISLSCRQEKERPKLFICLLQINTICILSIFSREADYDHVSFTIA